MAEIFCCGVKYFSLHAAPCPCGVAAHAHAATTATPYCYPVCCFFPFTLCGLLNSKGSASPSSGGKTTSALEQSILSQVASFDDKDITAMTEVCEERGNEKKQQQWRQRREIHSDTLDC
mmetsp:Transcript_22421/g.27670  ORF Transcript_22421/g.27670 Transcript_22421/m.27670 type:complete len:119 (+) Transcript_22421:121-477(+)